MKKLVVIFLAIFLLTMISGCFLFRINSRDFDCIRIQLRNDTLHFILKEDVLGLQLEVSVPYTYDSVVFSSGVMGITVEKSDSTIIAVTGKEDLKNGELLFTITDTNSKSLNSLQVKVEKVKSLPITESKRADNLPEQATTPEGLSIIGNEITLDSTGSTLVNCKGLSGVNGMHLEILFDSSLLELKKEDIEILCFSSALSIVEIVELGRAAIALAFFETREFVDEPILKLSFKGLKEGLSEVSFGTNTRIVSFSSEILSDTHCGVVNVSSSQAKLLGDFNSNGEVDLTDFITFARHYGIDQSDERYRILYDIAPASNSHDGIWSGIYDTCVPDGKIDLLDFIIFARNYGKSVL